MDTRQLQLFIHLAHTLHFGQTGQAMHMSASAVSRAVQKIEEELGLRLLERDNRQVSLTDAGRRFLEYAQQATSQWLSFRQQIHQQDEELRGEISVYCSVTATYSVLSTILASFRRRYPLIDIKLHTGDQADAIERVLAEQESIAIGARPDRLPARLQFQTLTHSPLLFIYPRTPCAVEQEVQRALQLGVSIDWQRLPFILSERGFARVAIDQWFRQQGVKPDIYAQVSGHEAIVSMVGLGFGVGVVPEIVLANSPLRDKVLVLDVQPPLSPVAIGVVVLKKRLDNALVKAFWQVARQSWQVDFGG